MGLFDRIRSGALDIAKDVTKGAASYLEEIEKQAQERELEKQKAAEKESAALQALEEEKRKILEEIEEERRKLREEREKLATDIADPSYTQTVQKTEKKSQKKEEENESEEDSEEEDSEELDDDWSDWDESEEDSDDIFGDDEDSQDDKGDLYPGTADEHTTLLEQLADMTAQQNELVRRLKDAGLEEQVREIVGSSDVANSLYAVDTDDLGALSFSAKSVTRQFRTALELMMKAMAASGEQREELMEDAKAAIAGAEQAASDVEQLAEEMEKKAEEIQGMALSPTSIEESIKYDWKRKPMYVSFGPPGEVFQKLDRIWNEISFGSPRDADGRPLQFPKFSPYATARGASLGTGFRVPEYAYKTETAFVNWCESVGLGEGVSLEVTSLMTKRGHRSLV